MPTPTTNAAHITRCILLGAGGHARVLLDILRSMPHVEVVGLLDPREALHGTTIDGCPVLGGDAMLTHPSLQSVTHVACAVGEIAARQRLAARTTLLPLTCAHATAFVSPSATLAPGVQVAPLAAINAAATIGPHTIINTRAVIEHDASIGPFCHIAPGAIVLGAATIAPGVLIGAGAVLLPGVHVGEAAVIGAGSVVTKDVRPGVTVLGNPARPA